MIQTFLIEYKMVDEKQIYVSFEKRSYKENKKTLLETQEDFIKLQKKLVHLKATRGHKKRLMEELNRVLGKIDFVIERLDTRLPDDKLPSGVKKLLNKKETKITKKETKKKVEKENIVHKKEIDSLDNELLEIQKKLKSLEG